MIPNRSLLFASIVSLAVGKKEVCRPAPELMYLHDASTSLNNMLINMTADIASLFAELEETYHQVRFGVASWADKPIVFRGVGNRNVIEDMDHCYVRKSALTDDTSQMKNALRDASGMCGGDFPENPYEAILGAATDPEAGWQDFPEAQKKLGYKPFRAIVFATDDVPHYAGDAQSGIAQYNAPRYPAATEDPNYIGGFGHSRLVDLYMSVIIQEGVDGQHRSDYLHMCDLWYKNDTKALDEDEKTALDDLILTFGPPKWWEVKKHPGTFDAVLDCEHYEYPSLDVVGSALRNNNYTVIGLLSAPASVSPASATICRSRGYSVDQFTPKDILGCMVAIYSADFHRMGVNAVIKPFESPADLKEVIATAISNAPEYACPVDPVVPPHHGGGGSNSGAIAGASGGAVAGLAALGGLAYRKFGGFSKGPSANPTIETNEEVPDTPMERESMEEVTMDMFQ